MEIRKVAVIGAGVMGGGIAAHCANAGASVRLLDIVPGTAARALARLRTSEPAAFMSSAAAALVTPSDAERDLKSLSEADWILEAIIEEPSAKRALYEQLEKVRRPGSIVSSNTSTIPLTYLTQGLPERFQQDFLITHFFNPPRYMRLLELVAGPGTRPDAVEAITEFADRKLGKGVVAAKDTPGFIANRIGGFWLYTALREAIAQGLSIEEVDAIMSAPFGIPRSGVFGLLDLVGVDLIPQITASMSRLLPPEDRFRRQAVPLALVERMIAEGRTGRKGNGGFYRLRNESGQRVKEGIDLATGVYRRSERPRLESVLASRTAGAKTLLTQQDRHGRYAWSVVSETLTYAADLVPTICDSVHGVDEAMRLGYGWRYGPFELIDRLGVDWFSERLRAERRPIPPLLELAAGRSFYRVEQGALQQIRPTGCYRPVTRTRGVLLLADVKRASEPLLRNGSAALWDLGDGVACFELTSKLGALDAETLDLLASSVPLVSERMKAMVIYSDGEQFSVGANLALALFVLNLGLWRQLEELVEKGQRTYQAIKYAPFPVVGAPSGPALGGGCEILLHCAAVQAHAETYMGLVETGVGIVPAWGGCKEMLLRQHAHRRRPRGPMPPISSTFELIGLAAVTKSAADAKERLFLREGDGITMNRDRLLADAKALALSLAEAWRPPAPPAELHLPGPTAKTALGLAVHGLARLGKATPHDVVVAGALAEVLSGGETDITQPVREEDLLALERRSFMRLVRHPATVARIEHMLETGKPLRN